MRQPSTLTVWVLMFLACIVMWAVVIYGIYEVYRAVS